MPVERSAQVKDAPSNATYGRCAERFWNANRNTSSIWQASERAAPHAQRHINLG